MASDDGHLQMGEWNDLEPEGVWETGRAGTPGLASPQVFTSRAEHEQGKPKHWEEDIFRQREHNVLS